jgi:hypothetical protein
MSSLLRLRADCVCLKIWRAVSERVAKGIAGLKGSEGSKEEMLLNSDTFVRNVVNLASDYSEGPNLIGAPPD